MFQIIDELSELVYVVDLSTYELLYMNRAGKESFGIKVFAGEKCYQLLQNEKAPCSFCTNGLLKEETFYTWERTNPKTQRHYVLKDKLIDWNGRKVRIEIAFDMTEKEKQQAMLRNEVEVGNLLTDCARKLCTLLHDDDPLNQVLSMLGKYLQSDRVYLFQIDGALMHNTHEWCAEQMAPQMENLQNMPVSYIERWQPYFEDGKPVIIENIDVLFEQSRAEYEILKAQGIYSLIAVALMWENRCIGYIGVDNFSIPMFGSTIALLTSLSYFISSALYRQWAMKQLEQLGYYDALTGLMNRHCYIRDQQQPLQPPIGVIYIDVNGTKQTNDQHGHQYGDQILIDVAQTIIGCCPDEQCYRVGGDEFVIISAGTALKTFQSRLQALQRAFQSKTHYSIALGTSWSETSNDIQKLLYDADERMYRDKQRFYRNQKLTGRYRYLLDDALGVSKPGALQQMIEEGRFLVYYQPKFSIDTNVIQGAEALVRYQSKEGAFYTPDRFIPILEEIRLISVLDYYVFEEVCRQLQGWITEGIPVVPISVNFSRRTLENIDFVHRLEQIREAFQIPLELLEIEITETVEEDDRILFQNISQQLRQKHFHISIDDFGVRNANLSLFIDLEFDTLKIDKHVTDQLYENEKSQLLVASLVDVCHKMDVKLIVEGIETQAQLEILQKMHCDEGQGYIFSRPLSQEAFEDVLRHLS